MWRLFLSRDIETPRPRPGVRAAAASGCPPLIPEPILARVVLSLTFRGTISDLLANASAQAAWEALFVAASRAFPSLTRSILTEIYLCHGCSYHDIEDGNGRAGAVA
jgi:hypothetical protein